MKYAFYIVSLTFVLASCSNGDAKKNERVPVEYDVITDSIYTSFPAGFIYTGKYVVWTDIYNEPLIHVIDPELKVEVAAFGSKGNGPLEFPTDESVGMYGADTIFAYDMNADRQFLYSLNDAAEEKEYVVSLPLMPRGYSNICLSKDSFVCYNCEYEDTPFRLVVGSDTVAFGKFPVEVDKSKLDYIYDLDASISYDPFLKTLICRASQFRYLALYDRTDSGFELKNEFCDNYEYTIENRRIKFPEENTSMAFALTKDYMVDLSYDFEKGEAPSPGRDFNNLPHVLFVRDHQGNLLRMFDLQKPTLRVAGCGNDNVLYAIIVDEEWVLVRIDLNKLMN